MTDRIPLDHLTSDQYDALCDQLDRVREAAHWVRRNYPALHQVNDRLRAALDEPAPATPATTMPRHDDGPSIAECREADRLWPLQKNGE